ncbi:hypothetical protein GSI_15562 [Ganoderma sinense ZZ0214-1]|uniref:F-box domain-containing protein n=1 Tax=Ganoderma sinense ZZ0214-1 TaxID=1077348 RepID=A0A2G8RMX8_9APHY|nr:hypothetical protein GSI_15562 [Ganoderma sinense ZZ0214-1]
MSMALSNTPEAITAGPQSHPTIRESWNVDVMHIIMSYADLRVVSNLMQTCSALNYAGTKYLLADGLTLRSEYGLVSFLYFFRAHGALGECARRLALLNKVTIDFYYEPSEYVAPVLECLFEVFALTAFNLTSLKISNTEALLVLHPPLGTAIAKLRTLKTVDFFNTGVHCATLLRTLQSSLVTVKLRFDLDTRAQEDDSEVLPEPDANPILLLEGSQSTLESLSVSCATPSPDGPYYPNMTHLELSFAGFPYVKDYIRAFPNLQSLTCFDYTRFGDELAWHSRRGMAIVYQVYHGTWRSLRKFEGSLLTLWVLGLTCHIHCVRLSFAQQLGVDPNFLNDVIIDVRPSELALRLPGAAWLLDDAVRAVLSEEGRLQVLEIYVLFHINEADDTVSVAHILNLLADVVRASSVPTFKLILDLTWMRVFRDRVERDDEKKLPLMPFEVYLQDMDVDAYVDTLLARVPSLKEVHVSVVEHRDRCPRQADRKRREPSTAGAATNRDETDASAS